MMRKMFSVALMATVACAFGLVQSATAGVTIDMVFQDATVPSGITVLPGDTAAAGCTFTGFYGNSVSTGRCMDVMLRTTTPLIALGISVTYDTDNGLALASMYEWKGVGLSFNAKGVEQIGCRPLFGLDDDGSMISSFDCLVGPPNFPPVLAPGTYRMGTIIWDTSAVVAGGNGVEAISAYFAGVDDVGGIINGTIQNISSSVVLGTHLLTIVPEPGTMSLLGLGLVGLVLAGRRRL